MYVAKNIKNWLNVVDISVEMATEQAKTVNF
jgi:hypothetical protein